MLALSAKSNQNHRASSRCAPDSAARASSICSSANNSHASAELATKKAQKAQTNKTVPLLCRLLCFLCLFVALIKWCWVDFVDVGASPERHPLRRSQRQRL